MLFANGEGTNSSNQSSSKHQSMIQRQQPQKRMSPNKSEDGKNYEKLSKEQEFVVVVPHSFEDDKKGEILNQSRNADDTKKKRLDKV